MNTPLIVLGSNLFALVIAVLFQLNITEVYSFLAFNICLLLFVGLVNLAGLVYLLTKNKDTKDDATRITIDSQ